MKKPFIPKGRFRPLGKLSLKMKLSALFVFAIFFSLQANNTYSQNTVSLNMKDMAVEKVLEHIENTTDYRFVYKIKDVDLQRRISIRAKDRPVAQVVSQIFLNSDITFNIMDYQILLVKRDRTESDENSLDGTDILPQGYEISGTVLGQDGSPLPGASIVEKGTTNGTQTDFDGNFSLT